MGSAGPNGRPAGFIEPYRGTGEHAMNTQSLPVPVKNSPVADAAFVIFLYAIVNGLSDNPAFTNSVPTAAVLKTTADGLGQANAKAETGGTADVAERNSQRKAAEELVDEFVAYVRTTVRAQAGDAATATAMITSVALSVRKRSTAKKPPLAAKYGPVSGAVLLVALAVAKSAMYWYEYSLDQKSWTSVPQIMKASITITGLTPGQVYYFRFHAQTRKGMVDYSQIVNLMVH
jgi:hypothetical protein